MSNNNAAVWIKKLGLLPHPEGGYYKETYRSAVSSKFEGFESIRDVSTGIYFMLTKGNFSAFHKIKSDEMWHFYDGDPVSIFVIDEFDTLKEIKLGLNIDKDELPQALVPANCWFASSLISGGVYALVGCTVSPGFDFKDFELAKRDMLLQAYPQYEKLIMNYTRREN
jgi:uncharacterized protein